MKYLLLTLVFIITAAVMPKPDEGTIKFTVIDKTTGNIITGCDLLEDKTKFAETGADGSSAEIKTPGFHNIQFHKTGYEERIGTYKVVANATTSYPILLTQTAETGKIKANILLNLKQKPVDKKLVQHLLDELRDIYNDNGYPETFDLYSEGIHKQLKDTGN